MHRIFKYEITPESTFLSARVVDMPVGAEVLDAQLQRGQLVLWAIVDPDAETEQRLFRVCMTGETVSRPERLRHISTLQYHEFVYHIFEDLD